MAEILVTGGAGYIGSTVCSALEDAGHRVIILDSLINGRREFTKNRPFYNIDIGDTESIENIFKKHPNIDTVIHFAALTIVEDSVLNPQRYYEENIEKAIRFLGVLIKHRLKRFIFSSSASIYDTSELITVCESDPKAPSSPYAKTKLMFEDILSDISQSTDMSVIALRYFNPIGADPKMRSGPYIKNPTHVLGKIIESYKYGYPFIIMGDDYPTRDGTAVRDYIHIWDLALAHVKTVLHFDNVFITLNRESGIHNSFVPINVGTGSGVTVRELLRAFEAVTGHKILQEAASRRIGDSVGAFADISLAKALIHWEPKYSTEQAIRHSLMWEDVFNSMKID